MRYLPFPLHPFPVHTGTGKDSGGASPHTSLGLRPQTPQGLCQCVVLRSVQVQGKALLSVGEAHKQTYPRPCEERGRGQGERAGYNDGRQILDIAFIDVIAFGEGASPQPIQSIL